MPTQLLKSGAKEINQLKAWTRCGMGPCQGRTCEDAIARIIAEHVGDRETVGMFTRRTPIKPIPMDGAIGNFKYEDIKKVEDKSWKEKAYWRVVNSIKAGDRWRKELHKAKRYNKSMGYKIKWEDNQINIKEIDDE